MQQSRTSIRWWAILTAGMVLLSGQVAWAVRDADFLGQVRDRIYDQVGKGPFVCHGEPICGIQLIPAFYQERLFLPVWIDSQGLKPSAHALIRAIRQIDRDGLQPADYHLAPIEALLSTVQNNPSLPPAQLSGYSGELDLLLTDAFLLLSAHLSTGRVNPETLHPDWLLATHSIDMMAVLHTAVTEAQLDEQLRQLRPNHRGYTGLQEALVRMRRMAESGGWPQVPGQTKLKAGDRDPRVSVLRQRLTVSGEWPVQRMSAEPELFDSDLVTAVKRFQLQHGLKPDGVVGQRTLGALNVSAEERVRQIELNLERWRWLPHDLGRRYIVVNTAGFSLRLVENDQVALAMKVVVGRPARKTPVFSSPMSHLVLNPYWNVPHKIASEDILAHVREQGPVYLVKQKIKLFNGWDQDAGELDPRTINWSAYGKGRFPFRLRQDPGLANSLGRIKFMFPNKFSVYLHDTPNRSLFALDKRDHSSGCIRVEDAFKLAVELLKNDAKWSPEKLHAKLKEGRTQTVRLTEPIPVHLLYLTAWVDEDGVLQFREDIYQRDTSLDQALKKKGAGLSEMVVSRFYSTRAETGLIE